MRSQLISNLQVLRFVAALSVLTAHAADLFLRDRGLLGGVPLNGGVDIFFLISGFVMTWVTRGDMPGGPSARAFLVRRAIRIVPAYWFFTTLLVLVVLHSPELVRNTVVDPESVATSYAFIPWPRPDGKINPILSQGWTLNYEAFFYLAFAAALLVKRGLIFLLGAFCALAAASVVVSPESFTLWFYTDPIILEFVAGSLLAQLYMAGVRLPTWGSGLCLALAPAGFLLLEPLDLDRFGRVVGWGLPASMVVASLVLRPEPKHRGIVRRLMQAGGDASYTIYLSHTFTINALAIVLRQSSWVSPPMAWASAVAISILAAVLFYYWVERPVTAGIQRLAIGKPIPAGQNVAP